MLEILEVAIVPKVHNKTVLVVSGLLIYRGFIESYSGIIYGFDI